MKTTFKFIIAAMAATAVFASCQKELGDNTSTAGQNDGGRVIYVEFDNSTKADLDSDGLTPKFKNGDMIKVSGGYQSEDCEIIVSGGVASFVTSISYNQDLTAIYPADAAVLNSHDEITGFKVPASQDGDIAKAIIAKAIIPEGESSDVSSRATFTSQIALFKVTPPDGVKEFTVTSLNTVESGVRTGDAVAINTEGYSDEEKLVITVSNNALSTFYVALVPGVNLSDLSFEYTTDDTHGAIKGISTKAITAAGKSDATATNTKYTINNKDWHPYVKIGSKKWATMNIGANTLTESGRFFAWGDVVGQTSNGSAWSDGGFSSTPAIGNPTTLPTSNDAAFVNWGGAWRMPTGGDAGELFALKNATYWLWDGTDKGYYVYNPQSGDAGKINSESSNSYDKSGALLFFPVAGNGYQNVHYDIGGIGNYWSSTLKSSATANARSLYLLKPNYGYGFTEGGQVSPTSDGERFRGYCIRPVAD